MTESSGPWFFHAQGRTLYSTGPAWSTDDDYLALLAESMPEQERVIAFGGRLMLRPPKTARRQVRALVKRYGFDFIGGAKSDNDRPWMIFLKKREREQ